MKCEQRDKNENRKEMQNDGSLDDGGVGEMRNQGSWTAREQKKYILFIQKHKYQLQNKQKRKDNKIFKAMALFIESRDGIQCRSHHMKLLRTHTKIKRIVDYFRRKFRHQFQEDQGLGPQHPTKQLVCPISENPLNKFSTLNSVKQEYCSKVQPNCSEQGLYLVNPMAWGNISSCWKFDNNFSTLCWTLWPSYAFYSLQNISQ